jgi:hypothetical protein
VVGRKEYVIKGSDNGVLFKEQPTEVARCQPFFKGPHCPAIFSSAAILHAGRGVDANCHRTIFHMRFARRSKLEGALKSESQGTVTSSLSFFVSSFLPTPITISIGWISETARALGLQALFRRQCKEIPGLSEFYKEETRSHRLETPTAEDGSVCSDATRLNAEHGHPTQLQRARPAMGQTATLAPDSHASTAAQLQQVLASLAQLQQQLVQLQKQLAQLLQQQQQAQSQQQQALTQPNSQPAEKRARKGN